MSQQITIYGADWCGDSVRVLRHLDRKGVKYDYIDVDEDQAGERKVIEFNKGKRRIPLVEIATETGTRSLSVPSVSDLDDALK
jgi:mycoredoxin